MIPSMFSNPLKKLSVKQYAIFTLISITVIAGLWYSRNSSKNESNSEASTAISPSFSAYISAYTAGVISNSSSIKIQLTQDYPDKELIGKEITEKLFQFSPSIEGKTYLLDSRTIEFQPNERLPSNTGFDLQFFLSKLFTVPSELETLAYKIKTMRQNFEVNVEGLGKVLKSVTKMFS